METQSGGSAGRLWAGATIVAESREFMADVGEPTEPDRMLATVLFTDIVTSMSSPPGAVTGGGGT